MEDNFYATNAHWIDPENFKKREPQLLRLSRVPLPYVSPLLSQFPVGIPGIYSLTGGRQIGKSTLLKQWMAHLLDKGIAPRSIAYLTGDIILDFQQLITLIGAVQNEMEPGLLRYIILDEVTYIKEWDRGIKFLADTGQLDNTCLLLSGSDLVLLSEARMRFPGRRGMNDQVDFHLYPLSFREFAILADMQDLSLAFQRYMIHGGYIRAINEWIQQGDITPSAFKTYSDWIAGDCLKRGKREGYLKELLQAILKTYATQVSWIALSQHTSIEHGSTVQDYCELLQSMDALFIQHALLEHKLLPAPKKAKRLFFTDPFIYHAVTHWLFPNWNHQSLFPEAQSALAETIVINHFRRKYLSYYIKGEGEVDLAYIHEGRFFPIEIKWTSQFRPHDIKQIRKYSQGAIWANVPRPFDLEGLPVIPLVQALYDAAG